MAALSPELQGRLEELDRELEVRFLPANRLRLDRRWTESRRPRHDERPVSHTGADAVLGGGTAALLCRVCDANLR
jgi:hypothetical protein